jgi:hypothetical protein
MLQKLPPILKNQKNIVVISNSLSIDILSTPPGLSKIDQIKLYKKHIFWLESKLIITKKQLAFEEAKDPCPSTPTDNSNGIDLFNKNFFEFYFSFVLNLKKNFLLKFEKKE